MLVIQKLATAQYQLPSTDISRDEIIEGLSRGDRQLPCKYFYDEYGSSLFDQICELDEYYVTRTETRIMTQYAEPMGHAIGRGAMLVEYGSGSSIKTRVLLDHLQEPVAYLPVDISREHLLRVAERLSQEYPRIQIVPVCADFTEPFDLPEPRRVPARTVVYFPGSTIGNFQPPHARRLLSRIRRQAGSGGGLLIGIDLRKDPAVIEAAYDDCQGVTAEFNLNLLRRINRELNADFQLDQFQHSARYNTKLGRVEIDLVSLCNQTVTIGNRRFEFSEGERIRTEHSYKYTVEGFAALAHESGLQLQQSWTDAQNYFAVLYLTA